MTRRFRKKPTPSVEAVQFAVENTWEIQPNTSMFLVYAIQCDDLGIFIDVPTPDGVVRMRQGDWIVITPNGEHQPWKEEAFDMEFEEVVILPDGKWGAVEVEL